MAIVLADSLDAYNSISEMPSSKRFSYIPADNTYTAFRLVPGAGRYGGNALQGITRTASTQQTQLANSNAQIPVQIPGYMTGNWTTVGYYGKVFTMGFWFKSVTNPAPTSSTPVHILFGSGGGSSATVLTNSSNIALNNYLYYTPAVSSTTNGTLTICQMGGGANYSTAACSVNLADGNYHWIELMMVVIQNGGGNTPVANGIANSPSFCQVYVDQIKIIDVPTAGGTVSGNIAQYPQYAALFFATNEYIIGTINGIYGNYYDDLVVQVGTSLGQFPMGPRRMACLRPNANGDVINFSVTGASDNYSAINQGYSNTTAYVQSTGFEQEDRYKFPALSYVPQNVNAVVANMQVGNFEPGTTIGMAPVLYDGTKEVVGAKQVLPQFSYGPVQTIYEVDNSGNAWTTSELNSIQVGFRSKA